MRPVLEDPALAEEPRDRALGVVADPRREGQPVRRPTVEIESSWTQPSRRTAAATSAAGPAEPGRVALVGDDVATELRDGDRLHGLPRGSRAPARRPPDRSTPPRSGTARCRTRPRGPLRVAVDRDVGRRVRVADEPVAAVRWPSTHPSALLPALHLLSSWSRYFSRSPISAIQNRAAAMEGSISYCSKNIHWRPRARSSGDSGGTPSRRQVPQDAFDSARHSPSSSSSVGTRSAGFLPPRISGRFDRSNTSS